MGLHSKLFLVNSTICSILGLVAIVSPATFLSWMFPSQSLASAAKYMPLFTTLVQFFGGAHILMASILCTASHRVSVDMCRSIGLGFAINAGLMAYQHYVHSKNSASIELPMTFVAPVIGYHAINALLMFVLSASAPKRAPADSLSARTGHNKSK